MISLFKWLPEYVVQWFVANANEVRAEPQQVLIKEDTQVDSLYVVLSGVLGVYLAGAGNRRVGTLGAGTVLGEISFVDESPSSATIIVEEKAMLLQVSRNKLSGQIQLDPRFAADFFKGLAATLAEKLRQSNEKLSAFQDAEKVDEKEENELMQRCEGRLRDFKKLLLQSDHEIQAKGKIETETYHALRDAFMEVVRFFHDTLGEGAEVHSYYREQVGARLQHELLPYVLMADTAGPCYTKPRGYAEDFETIERIYANNPAGKGRLGPIMDKLFLDLPVSAGIRNRKEMLTHEIHRAIRDKKGGKLAILCVGCGPAGELKDVLADMRDRTAITATLLDIDAFAVDYVRAWRDKMGAKENVTLLNDNFINVALGKSTVSLPQQDLIYSAGLFDYFDAKLAVKVLDRLHGMLTSGGRVLIGSFHPDNVCKELMEYVFEWHVHHRNEDELNAIFKKSAFGHDCLGFHRGDDRVCLIAECGKAP